MYLDYFSLERHPFRITPDTSLFFPGGAHGRGVVLDALVYGITSGEGILKVVGEVGSVVVFIEDAQSMPLETLEEVRLLSNLETHRHKLMQIVLFGQPELDRKLEQRSIRQLRERITHSF